MWITMGISVNTGSDTFCHSSAGNDAGGSGPGPDRRACVALVRMGLTADAGLMNARRWLVPGVAALVMGTGIVVALALPTYTCSKGHRFYDLHGPGGGPICLRSDLGYRPRSWWPTKIVVAAGGVVAGMATLLWRRRRLAAVGLIVVFAGLAVVWFIPDGYEEAMRNGRAVCCGREIDRAWLRTTVAAFGTGAGAGLILLALLRAASHGTHKPSARSSS